jgi:hypothetical protein
MKPLRAKCLAYLGSERRSTGFRHFYDVDGRRQEFFTSVNGLALPEHSLKIAAAHAGLANLIDLISITLPEKVMIDAIQLNREALAFWKETARNVAAERIAEDDLPASVLDARWTSGGALHGRMDAVPQKKRGQLLAMSGGKESLAALKQLEGGKAPTLFFLHYPDSGWHHGRRLLEYFSRTHECVKVRCDITSTRSLVQKYRCGSYGIFVIGQIVFSALLFMDRFSRISIGNEFSANFGNGTHDGVPVNHQYDKSFAFARRLNAYLAAHVTDDFTHDSPFWDWYEYRIARDFFLDARHLRHWTSCNNSTASHYFCGACAKCAFVFLLGAAHGDAALIRRLMDVNMLYNLPLIRSLADIEAPKPLECVGTKEEVWVALEDIWQKCIWRSSPGLLHYAAQIRPVIESRLPAMKRELLRNQSLKPFGD